MPKNILEEYKKAIIKQYQKEKSGENYRFLENPSRAKLRDLCWERFKKNDIPDDLKNFETFFEFSFELTKKNELKKKTGKFRSVGDFLRNETESPTDDIIELAAILVDFKPRPYSKFRRIGLSDEEIKTLNESDSLILDKENQNEGCKINDGDENIDENLLINKKEPNKFSERFKNKLRWTMVTTTIIFCLIATVIYFALFKKDCMQWTGDYYEKVDCIQEINSLDIKPYDEIQFLLKKVKVSDTTSFFKVGKPCVWYGKSVDGNYECFNIPGLHPETGKTLKPITQYIADKYLLKKRRKNRIKEYIIN